MVVREEVRSGSGRNLLTDFVAAHGTGRRSDVSAKTFLTHPAIAMKRSIMRLRGQSAESKSAPGEAEDSGSGLDDFRPPTVGEYLQYLIDEENLLRREY